LIEITSHPVEDDLLMLGVCPRSDQALHVTHDYPIIIDRYNVFL